MRIKHIDGLSGSLNRKTELINSGTLPLDVMGLPKITVANYRDANNTAYLSASNFHFSDDDASANTIWSSLKTSNTIGNATIGLGGAVLPAVANIAELTGSYSQSAQLTDRQFILVEDQGLYRFDLQSSTTVSVPTVLKPHLEAGNGRWFKISLNTEIYLRKPNTGYVANRLLMASGGDGGSGDSGLLSTLVPQFTASDSTNERIVFTSTGTNKLKTVSTYDKTLLDSLAVGAASSPNHAVFYDDNNKLTYKSGYTTASIAVTSSFPLMAADYVATLNSLSQIKKTTIKYNDVVTAASSTATYFPYYEGAANSKTLIVSDKFTTSTIVTGSTLPLTNSDYIAVFDGAQSLKQTLVRWDGFMSKSANTLVDYPILFAKSNGQTETISGLDEAYLKSLVKGAVATYQAGKIALYGTRGYVSASSVNVEDVVTGAPVATYSTGQIAIYDAANRIVSASNLSITSIKTTSNETKEYTITLVKNITVAGAGKTLVSWTAKAPTPINKSQITVVSVAGIVYSSASTAAAMKNEEYYVDTATNNNFGIYVSCSYSIDSDEPIVVSYMSNTSA